MIAECGNSNAKIFDFQSNGKEDWRTVLDTPERLLRTLTLPPQSEDRLNISQVQGDSSKISVPCVPSSVYGEALSTPPSTRFPSDEEQIKMFDSERHSSRMENRQVLRLEKGNAGTARIVEKKEEE